MASCSSAMHTRYSKRHKQNKMAGWNATVNLCSHYQEICSCYSHFAAQKCVAVCTEVAIQRAPKRRTLSIPEMNLRRYDIGLCADVCTVWLVATRRSV